VVCSHKSTVTTVTAGLEREVCESCGHVSLRYVAMGARLRPEVEKPGDAPPIFFEAEIVVEVARHRRCMHCAQPAVFMIPDGMTCTEHAWQAAARLDWEATDPWVPIRIDRLNPPRITSA
jgi:hypothetical protein